MDILPFESSDLRFLEALQPPGWSDLAPYYQYYMQTPYCRPIKVLVDNIMVGIGNAIFHADSAWLAHIVVHPGYRNKGLGTIITQSLIQTIDTGKYKTIFLLATDLGAPVYGKLGFEAEAEYWFFKDGQLQEPLALSERIVPFDPKYTSEILELDLEACGEDRAWRIKENLAHGLLYISNNTLLGYYLPTLLEGVVIARNQEAGIELLKIKHAKDCLTVIPINNKPAVEFFEKNNFKVYRKALRMRLGLSRSWRPDYIYSRVSGQIG